MFSIAFIHFHSMFLLQRESLLKMGEHFHNIAMAGFSLTNSTIELTEDNDSDNGEFVLSVV